MQKNQKLSTALAQQLKVLENLLAALSKVSDISAKHKIIISHHNVRDFINSNPIAGACILNFDQTRQYVLYSMIVIGQAEAIFFNGDEVENHGELFSRFVNLLVELEEFYSEIGGVIGYHAAVLKLLISTLHSNHENNESAFTFDEPEGLDCNADTQEIRQAVRWGVEHLPELAEIYPIGGAGERLHLKDPTSGELLPAAQLLFCGRTLLEGLIRDLIGREFLYYKLYGRQLSIPLAAMTSHEKNNHQRVQKLCESMGWFGRPQNLFKFFLQPLVPVITSDGEWAMQAPLEPILRPGGHGVIWKAALENNIFEWFEKQGCSKGLVRQINNPMAGVDNGLLILSGIGCHHNKGFGFASCYRLLSTSEGMDVLRERPHPAGYEYCITNVEYTDFEKAGIKDVPVKEGSSYSRFPANTNILFVDFKTIKQAMHQCSIPGKLINMKTLFKCYQGDGKIIEKHGGRLESTMQNIADWIVDLFPKRLKKGESGNLRTFITYNAREKTISVAKQAYEQGKSIIGTPEDCFYDLMENYYDLLVKYCAFKMPKLSPKEEYISKGPEFTVLFHPALGGLYSVIAQKIHGGHLAKGSEWIMEIAEAQVINMDLQGSLWVEAVDVTGPKTAEGVVRYDSDKCGKCTLINVKVKNKGLAKHSAHEAWQRKVERKECLHITLNGNGEFFAENVHFEGDLNFDVPSGYRCVVVEEGCALVTKFEKIKHATWKWDYAFDEEHRIKLTMK